MTNLRWLGGLVVVLLTASACVSLPGVEPDSPAPADGQATPGGVIKVGMVQPRTLDPADASDPDSQLVVRTMCDTLLDIDPETGELVPGIADRWSVTTESGVTRILARLRQDVYFPDGTQVDARVVVNSLSRLAREETAGSMAPLLSDVVGYNFVRGQDLDELPSEEATETLFGARVSDPFGIELLIDGEDVEWVHRLANPATAIVDDARGRADPLAFARQPTCAGPYQLRAAWNPGDEIIRLVRNEHYHGSPWAYTRDGAGYADEVLFYVFNTVDEAYAAFARGRMDVAPVPVSIRQGIEPVPAPLEAPLPTFDTFQASYVTGNDHLMMYVGLPGHPDGLFADDHLRVALSQALDRQRIVAEAYGGDAVAAAGFLPPVVGPAHRERACVAQMPPAADPAAARATLAESSVDLAGQTMPLYYFSGYPANELVATAVAESWESALGLTATPAPLEEEDFLALAGGGGADGPFLMGWDGGRLGAPQAYLRELVGSGEEGNVTGYTHPGLDYYLRYEVASFGSGAGDGLATQQEQLIAVERMEDWVCQLMPLIPVASMQSHWLVHADRLGSAREFVLDVRGDPALRELWVRPLPTPTPTPEAEG